VGVIRIDDGGYPLLPKVFDALPIVEFVNDFNPVLGRKEVPYGGRKFIGKEMNMEVDYLLRQLFQGKPPYRWCKPLSLYRKYIDEGGEKRKGILCFEPIVPRLAYRGYTTYYRNPKF